MAHVPIRSSSGSPRRIGFTVGGTLEDSLPCRAAAGRTRCRRDRLLPAAAIRRLQADSGCAGLPGPVRCGRSASEAADRRPARSASSWSRSRPRRSWPRAMPMSCCSARAALREPSWPQRAAAELGLSWRDAPYPPALRCEAVGTTYRVGDPRDRLTGAEDPLAVAAGPLLACGETIHTTCSKENRMVPSALVDVPARLDGSADLPDDDFGGAPRLRSQFRSTPVRGRVAGRSYSPRPRDFEAALSGGPSATTCSARVDQLRVAAALPDVRRDRAARSTPEDRRCSVAWATAGTADASAYRGRALLRRRARVPRRARHRLRRRSRAAVGTDETGGRARRRAAERPVRRADRRRPAAPDSWLRPGSRRGLGRACTPELRHQRP